MALLISSLSFAQGTSVVTGTVTDAATGKPVPDVVITARSPALQGEEIVVTDTSGTYRIGQLPPGTFELSMEKESYKPFKRTDIQVRVDRTVRVNIQLQPEALQSAVVEVIGKPPTVDVGNTTTGVNVGKDFINNISFIQPNGAGVRTFESLAAVAPQVVGDLYGYGFSGAQSPENLYLVDGVSVSDNANGLNGAQFPVEFVEETNVITGGYMAEYGRATGGVMNVVTKSGSNEFHGSVWGDWTPGILSGTPRAISSDGSVRVGQGKLWNSVDMGAEVGGPIIKDRLWFYVGFSPSFVRDYSQISLRRFLVNSAGNDFVYCSAQDVADKKCTQEEYDQGFIKTEALPNTTRSEFLDTRAFSYIAKLTFLINSDNNVSLSVIGSPTSSSVPYLFNTYAPLSGINRSGYTATNNTATVALKYQGGFLDKHLLVDVSLGWFHTDSGFTPLDGSKLDYTLGTGVTGTPEVILARTRPYGINDLEILNPDAAALCEAAGFTASKQVDVRGTARYVMACPVTGAGNTYTIGGFGQVSQTASDRLQARASVTYLAKALGHHIIKAGLDIEQDRYDVTKAEAGGDTIKQTGSGNYYYDYRAFGYLGAPDEIVQQKYLHVTPISNGIGAYVQDSWSILDLVTLNAGLRYETQQIIASDNTLGMTLNNMLAPRIGVIYDFTQQGRSKFYANYSRYFEAVPMDMADRALSGENQYTQYHTRASSASRPGCDPLADIANTYGKCLDQRNYLAVGGTYDVSQVTLITSGGKSPVDPGILPQSTDEIVVGGEYEIISDGRLGVTYTRRYMNQVIEDMSLDEANTYFLGNPGYGIAASFPKAVRDYDAVTAYFTKSFSDGWMAQASYTWSYLRGNYNGLFRPETGQLDPNINSDFDLISLLPNHTGPLGGDRTHFIKAFASKEFVVTGSLAFVLGLTYTGRSGAAINYYGAHEIYGADEVFVLPRGSGGRLPWAHSVNVKGGVTYHISKDNAVTLTADVFNVLNLQALTSVDETLTNSSVLPFIVGPGQNPQTAACLAGQSRPECQKRDADGDIVLPVTHPDGTGLKVNELNPNYKRPTSYQAPISVRFGVKVTF